jgi:2-oxoglutarate ferredoxin oxidoreductase subunit alpha
MGLEFIEGNEAIARAAIKAGCRFFAGYPITPASTILQYMLELLPEVGGVAMQAEDEIASIGFCIGASMAGTKAMTATSGPGISLYSENIGLAIMGETPLVIVDIQRQGPATGSATKGAEGDIQFARWVTSGGLPIIALSPATVAEAYEFTYRAFNLAEQYRSPVFLLASKEIGLTQESVDLEAVALPPPVERRRPERGADYQPHYFERLEEVPALADIGSEHITQYTTSTHGKDGYLTADPALIEEMIEHYAAKIEAARDEIALYRHDRQEDADTLVVSYGVTSRAAEVAVARARAAGRKVSSLVLKTLFPVPETVIVEALRGVDKVVVPEMNLGQYILDVERLAPSGVAVVGVNKMDTTLISPAEIIREGGLL